MDPHRVPPRPLARTTLCRSRFGKSGCDARNHREEAIAGPRANRGIPAQRAPDHLHRRGCRRFVGAGSQRGGGTALACARALPRVHPAHQWAPRPTSSCVRVPRWPMSWDTWVSPAAQNVVESAFVGNRNYVEVVAGQRDSTTQQTSEVGISVVDTSAGRILVSPHRAGDGTWLSTFAPGRRSRSQSPSSS